MTISDDTLIYDIETHAIDGNPNPQKDILKFFGCYSYKTKKYYIITEKEQIQKIINAHKYLVGFNNEGTKQNPGYDNPILRRSGIDLKYKIFIDSMSIFIQRANQMKIKKGMLADLLMEYSLDFITKTLDLVDENTSKETIDYSIFNKSSWTTEELEKIHSYLKRDIEITKKLYEWIEDYFEGFKDYISEKDISNKTYLRVGFPKFAYKVICKEMNWQEKYGQAGLDKGIGESISGGYVAYPAGERFEGKIYCMDWNSLYPHIMMQCNIYGSKRDGVIDDRPIWTGDGKWKVTGTYYSDELSKVGKLIRKYYNRRLFYKRKILLVEDKKEYKMKDIRNLIGKHFYYVDENDKDMNLQEKEITNQIVDEYEKLWADGVDRREYTLKIVMNIMFGILDESYYQLVYDKIGADDITSIGRQWIIFSRKIFREEGYIIIYSDTDSDYILDPFDDKEKLLKVKDKIVKYIKDSVPFPQDTFDMGIDDEITHMFFFKAKGKNTKIDEVMDDDDFLNKPKNFMKKNYIYITTDKKIVIKNLGIRKKSNSPLSRKIFWDYLVPQMIENGEVKFSKTYIKNLMIELLEKDIKLACFRKSVKPVNDYANTNVFPAQVSAKYGPGIKFLIPNTVNLGVGKGCQFCTLEEFTEKGLTIDNIDFDLFWSELDYFIMPIVTKSIFDF